MKVCKIFKRTDKKKISNLNNSLAKWIKFRNLITNATPHPKNVNCLIYKQKCESKAKQTNYWKIQKANPIWSKENLRNLIQTSLTTDSLSLFSRKNCLKMSSILIWNNCFNFISITLSSGTTKLFPKFLEKFNKLREIKVSWGAFFLSWRRISWKKVVITKEMGELVSV